MIRELSTVMMRVGRGDAAPTGRSAVTDPGNRRDDVVKTRSLGCSALG
jgi:hypothetical protein